jgi:RNA-binding protein
VSNPLGLYLDVSAFLTPVPDLTSKQRAHLRSLSHTIKPTIHVGKEGVTTAAIRSVRQAFAHRELLKVRVLDTAPEETRDAAHALAAGVEGAVVVQVVGRSATLYRPDPHEPEIKLPS